MTPNPGLLQANIDFLPANAAELDFSVTSIIESGDPRAVQSLWDPNIIIGLAQAKTADSILFGRLLSLIENKYRKEINVQSYRQAIKDKQREMRLQIDRKAQILPDVQTNNRPMRDQSLDILRALVAQNDPPRFFARGGQIVEIRRDEKYRPTIQILSVDQFRGVIDRTCNYVARGENGIKIGHPPLDIVKDIMSLTPAEWGLPSLDAIVEVPTLRPDGTVLDQPGYDLQTGLFYSPDEGFHMNSIPDELCADDVDVAVAMVQDIIEEFPLGDKASRSHIFALMLTPIIRPAIGGCVPLCLIDAPQAGTGKSLLANVAAVITTGHPAPMQPFPKDDVELDKRVGSSLMAGRQFVCFDNLENVITSPTLALTLTCRDYETRPLGFSKMITVVNRATWLATGNNLRPSGDMPRRCYRIRIDARSSTPYMDRSYKYPDLLSHVQTHRAELLRSLLIVARAWYLAGKPPAPGTPLGSFEEWYTILNGILKYARIEGFMSNFTDLLEVDDDAIQWERFIDGMAEHWFGGRWFQCQHVASLIRTQGQTTLVVPDSLADVDVRKDGMLERAIGRSFAKRRGRRYGPQAVYLEKSVDEHTNIAWWRAMNKKMDADKEMVARHWA